MFRLSSFFDLQSAVQEEHVTKFLYWLNLHPRTEFTRYPETGARSTSASLPYALWGSPAIYDVDLVRKLCLEISASTDPQRIDDLLGLIQAIISDDHDELRLRLNFLREKYAAALDSSKTQNPAAES